MIAGNPLAEIGAHGWSHRALASLAAEELKREIGENVRTLSDSLEVGIISFAYPFGGPLTPETQEILREFGIQTACRIGGEPVTGRSDRLALPRLEVGDWSGEELEMRLNVLLEN
jgi:peptidoglycan/xylan/chitin deacetylase (PgdA/CDA1 family)